MFGMDMFESEMSAEIPIFQFYSLSEDLFDDLVKIDDYSFLVHLDIGKLANTNFFTLGAFDAASAASGMGGLMQVDLKQDMSLDSISFILTSSLSGNDMSDIDVTEIIDSHGWLARTIELEYHMMYQFSDHETEKEPEQEPMNMDDILNSVMGVYSNDDYSLGDLEDLFNGFGGF